jgi:hypothetical protein
MKNSFAQNINKEDILFIKGLQTVGKYTSLALVLLAAWAYVLFLLYSNNQILFSFSTFILFIGTTVALFVNYSISKLTKRNIVINCIIALILPLISLLYISFLKSYGKKEGGI